MQICMYCACPCTYVLAQIVSLVIAAQGLNATKGTYYLSNGFKTNVCQNVLAGASIDSDSILRSEILCMNVNLAHSSICT